MSRFFHRYFAPIASHQTLSYSDISQIIRTPLGMKQLDFLLKVHKNHHVVRRLLSSIVLLLLSCLLNRCGIDPDYNSGNPYSREFLLTNLLHCLLADPWCPAQPSSTRPRFVAVALSGETFWSDNGELWHQGDSVPASTVNDIRLRSGNVCRSGG